VVYFAKMKNLPTYFKEHEIGECAPEKNIADFALERVKAVDSSYTQKMEKSKDKEEDGQKKGSSSSARPSSEGEKKEAAAAAAAASAPKPSTAGTKDLALEFRESREGQESLKKLQKGIAPRTSEAERKEHDENLHSGPRTSFMVQFHELQKRFFLNTIRNRQTIGVRFVLTIFLGFVVGTLFLRQGFDQAASDERVSAVFVTLLFVMFTANAFLPEVFSARPMYFREVTSDMYGPGSFYVARYTADIPFVILENLILALMTDYMANLGTDPSGPFFGWYWFALIACRYASVTATYAIGTIIELANNANTIHATYFNLLFAFSGFLIPGVSIPPWWWWFYYIDYLRWSLHFIAAFMVRNQNYYCNPNQNELIPVYPQFYTDCALTAQDYFPGNQNPITGTPATAPRGTPIADLPVPPYNAANPPFVGGMIDYTTDLNVNSIYRAGPDYTNVYQTNTVYPFSQVNLQGYGITLHQNTPVQDWIIKCNWQCGVDLLNFYGVHFSDNWLAAMICIVWGFALFFGVVGYVALKYINWINR
jgi:hypothetical protein